jgi:hypothetical protein
MDIGFLWLAVMILWFITMILVGRKLKDDRFINGYLISGGILFPAIYLWKEYASGFNKLGWFAFLLCFLFTGLILHLTAPSKSNKEKSELNK